MNIIWPYDPFLRDAGLDKIAKSMLSNFFTGDRVEAVYMASHAETELSYAYNIPARYRYGLYPRNLIEKQLTKLKIKNAKVKVIESSFLSTTKMAGELASYARESKADLIMLATNSKKDLPKFIFGSFAETFLHLSPVDTLVYQQKNSPQDQAPERILYAHDFTRIGSKGLLKAINYAEKWKATLYVVHIPIPVPELSDEEFIFSVENNLRKCEHLLEKMGVKFKVVNLLDDITIDDLTIDEVILDQAAKFKIDLISMPTKAGRLERLLGGSISRKILRGSKKPVLIFKL